MKNLLSIILTVTLLSQNLVYTAIGFYYHINKEYIVHQLCENRNNPQMHCNGKCYLSKQLKKAEAGENKSAQVIKEQDEVIINDFKNMAIVYFPAYSSFEPVRFNTGLYTSDGTDYLLKPPIG